MIPNCRIEMYTANSVIAYQLTIALHSLHDKMEKKENRSSLLTLQ